MSTNNAAAPVRRALLLIDFQRDFLEPSGRLPIARNHVAPVPSAAARAIDEAKAAGDLVVAIGNEFRSPMLHKLVEPQS